MGLMGANKGFRADRGFRGMGEGDCKRVRGEKNQENQHKWLEMFCYLAEFQ